MTYRKKLYEEGLPRIIFSCEDLVAEHARLVEAGVLFKSEPEKVDWGMQSTFDDGFGNYIMLIQTE